MRNFKYIFFVFIIVSCNSEFTVKPMKYNRHGMNLSCDAYYKEDILHKVICFSKNRDTVLIEGYKNGLREGISEMRYTDGSIREVGNFKQGHQFDNWTEFHPNGNLKSFRHFKLKNDTSYMIYEKIYDNNGEIQALRYPLKFRTNNKDSLYRVGVTYQLYIELEFSEFDSLNSYGFIKESVSSNVQADTLSFQGNSLYIEFAPQYSGQHSIKGTYFEIDGSKNDSEYGYGGEKEWEFKYHAK